MMKRTRCTYCDELAVAYRLEKDGTKVPICAWHIPTQEQPLAPTGKAEAAKTEGTDSSH
jgi:hypothetical protein